MKAKPADTQAGASAMSEAEAIAVGKLLVAYKRTMADDLARASDGGRVFVIITAPAGRPGPAHLFTNAEFVGHGHLVEQLLGLLNGFYGDPVLLNMGDMDA